MQRIVMLFVGCAFTACGSQVSSDVQKIIDNNDLITVAPHAENIPEKFRPLVNAIGLMSIGCTVTHIGNGLVLTAGHCFESQRYADINCKRSKVSFGFRQGVEPYLVTKCKEVVAMEYNETKDFAIFRVEDVPNAKIELETEQLPADGSPLVAFQHPQRRPLEWTSKCKIERGGQLSSDLNVDFKHDCDTETVSSGSAIIDANTLKIVGVHDGSVLPWNYGTLISKTPELLSALKTNLL